MDAELQTRPNPVRALAVQGQAVWLDYLHRRILDDGELVRLIAEDGISGLTSNPSIFEQAIAGSHDYDTALAAEIGAGRCDATDLYERLAVADIRRAADAFRPLFDNANGTEGFVSLEVSPHLAFDTEATIAEARRLWAAVDRPNLMIKVPGVGPGVSAVRTLIGQGINVNVTLLFALDAYLAVADAHLAGLERFAAAGGDVARVHGVASFFVSRIDSEIDTAIDRRAAVAPAAEARRLQTLRGKVAIANARLAYRRFLELTASPRWRALAAAGAHPQRLLWASTGTKDSAYSDVIYVESLIGPETVDTLPPKTLAAFRDHGVVTPTLAADFQSAEAVLAEAHALGLDLDAVTDRLAIDGVAKFADAFDTLLTAVAVKRDAICAGS